MNIQKLTSRPGFEFIFAVGIAAIFIIPSAVMAQSNKNIEISISNGDTVVNGKNIKELNAKERQEALKDLNTIRGLKGPRQEIRLDRRSGGDTQQPGTDLGMSHLNIEKTPDGFIVNGITDGHNKELHVKRKMEDTSTIAYTYSYRFNDDKRPPMGDGPEGPHRGMRPDGRGEERSFEFDGPRGGGGRGMMGMGFNRRNSQSFNYSNTDGQGITTRVNFRVTEPEGERLRNIAGTDKADLDITGLKLVPDFTSGKILLMFNLPSKAAAEVQLTDGEGKVLWTEKSASETFSKNFALPLNGIYHLKVKQGGKVAVKQIFKEE